MSRIFLFFSTFSVSDIWILLLFKLSNCELVMNLFYFLFCQIVRLSDCQIIIMSLFYFLYSPVLMLHPIVPTELQLLPPPCCSSWEICFFKFKSNGQNILANVLADVHVVRIPNLLELLKASEHVFT